MVTKMLLDPESRFDDPFYAPPPPNQAGAQDGHADDAQDCDMQFHLAEAKYQNYVKASATIGDSCELVL